MASRVASRCYNRRSRASSFCCIPHRRGGFSPLLRFSGLVFTSSPALPFSSSLIPLPHSHPVSVQVRSAGIDTDTAPRWHWPWHSGCFSKRLPAPSPWSPRSDTPYVALLIRTGLAFINLVLRRGGGT